MKNITAKRVLLILSACITLLLVLHIVSYINFYTNQLSTRDFFFRKFNLSEEKNVPSIFSGLLHLTASLLLFKIATIKLKIDKKKFFWISLGVLFLFLGLDELFRIHESVARFMTKNYPTDGAFLYGWVIPYGIAVIIIGLLYLKPLLSLPKRTMLNFVLSGSIFLIGAIGLEMASGWYWTEYNISVEDQHFTIPLFILYTFEELFEMLGISLFIYELWRFKNKYAL